MNSIFPTIQHHIRNTNYYVKLIFIKCIKISIFCRSFKIMVSTRICSLVFGLVALLSSAYCIPVETTQQLKEEIKGIKSEIQELFERINDLSSSKGSDTVKATPYTIDDRVCLSKDCIATSHHLFKQMDLKADPCQDFNQFACGRFINEQIIPDDKTRYNAFSPARDIGR